MNECYNAICGISPDNNFEPPENFVIESFQHPRSQKYTIALKACYDFIQDVMFSHNKLDTYKDDFIRFCRVIDVASPPELKDYIFALFVFVLGKECSDDIKLAALRAVLGYEQSEYMSALLNYLLDKSPFSAYIRRRFDGD